MASVETPPNPAPPETPARVRSGRFGDLEHHELIHLLDTLDDERARGRFREAIYVALLFYLAVGWFIFYGPQVLFHQPRLINPIDVMKQHDRELTYLNLPPDLSKPPIHKPRDIISDRDRTQQTARPSLDKKTLEQLQAMRAPGAPAPTRGPALPSAPEPQPRANNPAESQPPAASTQQPSPARPPQPTQQAIVEAPRPAPTRPSFAQPTQSAGDAVRRAAQQAAQNRRGGGDFGAGVPVEHQGENTSVEVLSDTMGVNFDPYLRRILRTIYNSWLPLIPEEARPPLNKSGVTQIRFTIMSDGTIGAMHLDGSTHDDSLNRAAWGSITGVGQFPPLPPEFRGPSLELRIHYLVNKTSE